MKKDWTTTAILGKKRGQAQLPNLPGKRPMQ